MTLARRDSHIAGAGAGTGWLLDSPREFLHGAPRPLQRLGQRPGVAAVSARLRRVPRRHGSRRSQDRDRPRGWLQQRMLHYSYWSYDEYFQRLQRYTSYQAQKWHREGRCASVVQAGVQHAAAVPACLHLPTGISRWPGRVPGLRADGILFIHEASAAVAIAARAERGRRWTASPPAGTAGRTHEARRHAA